MSDAGFPIDEFVQPVLVAGVVPFWGKILMWLFRGWILLLLYLWFQNGFVLNDETVLGVCFFGIPYLVCEVILFAVFLKRRWLLATDDGFIYSSLFGSEAVQRENIKGYSIQIKELPNEIHFFGKVHTKIRRRFNIWVQGRNKPICLKYTSNSSKPDPLFGFIMQTTDELNKRFEIQIKNGGTVEGNGWSLTGNVLHFETKSGTDTVVLEEIGSTETLGNRLQIWRRGSQEACFSAPADAENTFWLAGYIGRNILPDETPVEGLGKFLFEKKRPAGWIYPGTGAVLLTAMIFIPFVFPKDDGSQTVLLVGEIIAGIFLCFLPFFWAFSRGLRFYENGLIVRYPRFEKEILFDDVETFEWYRTDQYVNGGYSGTVFTFTLFLEPETGIKKLNLNYSHQKGEEGESGAFRQKLTAYLADRMRDEWMMSKRVCWVENTYLTDTAVVFEKKKRGEIVETVILPYDQIEAAGMTTAKIPTFGIVHKDGQQGLQFGTGNKNFFPGLSLFERIMRKELMWKYTVKGAGAIDEEK